MNAKYGMLTCLGLFYDLRLENRIYSMFLFNFFFLAISFFFFFVIGPK